MDDLEVMSRSAARDASDAVERDGASDTCHEKACALPATTTRDRCGQRFCATHRGEFALQRRDDPSTYAESYTLCAPAAPNPFDATFLNCRRHQACPQAKSGERMIGRYSRGELIYGR